MVTSNESKVNLVQLGKTDIPGLIALSESVGWDYDENEIASVLSSGNVFGHKNTAGEIVSSAAVIPYENRYASIGMVIVNNDYRGMGLGKEATQRCIQSLSNDLSIMLIATEDGKPLYEKMGFKTVDRVHKYICNSYTRTHISHNKVHTIENYKECDLHRIIELDEAAFGDKRTKFLTHRIKQAGQCIVVKDDKGDIIGFGLSINGPVNLIIGPLVAPDASTAALLLDKLAGGHRGNVRIDIPSGNEQFLEFVEKSGFTNVNHPPVMMFNSNRMPKRNGNLFGIAAQIFG
ncbi:GNAT family N-acetyltransferase [Lysinibacillus sphaericus]